MNDPNEIQIYPILTLKNTVLFPNAVRPLFFNRPQSLEALREARNSGRRVFVTTLRNPDADPLKAEDLYEMGVIGTISKLQRLPNGALQVLFNAESRGHLLNVNLEGSYFTGKVQTIHSRESADAELPMLTEALRNEFFDFIESERKPNMMPWNEDLNSKDVPAGRFADAVAPYIQAEIEDLQEILSTLDTRERVEKVYTLLVQSVKQREFEQKLKAKVEEQMEKRQREYYLNEQMRAIQEELGEGEVSEFEALEAAIKEAGMPEQVEETALKELAKLKKTGSNSHETTPIRNYLDWLIALPWRKTTEDRLDLNHAIQILDDDHYGMEKPKERILEFLAVSQAKGSLKGPIICLSGPPGVGKTSLAKSVAEALGRKFARISLGGVRDEAEIRGHRRTYVGALPGKIIQTMKKVGTSNPVLLLDEIDKMSQHYMGGGPIAAMLEVLDPEQNNAFMDHYLEVEYDLSSVLFICTANNLADIPLPLRDRMEIIELSGYTELEKLQIAKKYLVPKQLKENGLQADQLRIGDKMILDTIRGYTREAGVRGLDRAISKICRKAVTERLKTKTETKTTIINKTRLSKYLGPARFMHNQIEKNNEVGMVTGLAWTSVGGETLSIEVTTMKGAGKVQLTGTLGDVMKESAHAALSFVRGNANQLGVYSKVFKDLDIHIHVPAGGTPKDGPSAGIALASGIVSSLTNVPVNWNVGLTGEITLRGNVLPIGGLKEKLLAAKRAQLNTVIIPKENEKDLVDIPKEILKSLKVIPAKHISEVFPVILEGLPIAVNDDDLAEDESYSKINAFSNIKVSDSKGSNSVS